MVTSPVDGASVEDVVQLVLHEAHLGQWEQPLIFGKQIRRLAHFSAHDDREYKSMGMSPDEVRRLRTSVSKMQKSMSTRLEPQLVYVKNENSSMSTMIDPNKTVITKEQIKLMESIGEGTFAIVKRALWYHPEGKKIDVAVKILRDVSPVVMEDLQMEASHLLKLQHPHLIRLYGVIQQPAMMVFELCEGGALLDRLRDSDKPVPLLTVLLDYCIQISKAMAYLEAKHCVHRDLAARNILLTRDEKVVKICDFGLMRNLKENEQMYIMGPQKRVPFSWCPPESLKQRKFSHASDVWAFGVTVWEVFSLGEEPWIGCRAIEVLKRIDAGERLEKPINCSNRIYDLIGTCWKVNPDHRPRFTHLKGLLQQAQFNVAEVREAYSDTKNESSLDLAIGDRVIVIEATGVTWHGQNERTRKFGSFLRQSVFVHSQGMSKPSSSSSPYTSSPSVAPVSPSSTSSVAAVVASVPVLPHYPLPAPQLPSTSSTVHSADPGGSSRISLPIKGSFIHTGHADTRGGQSWGRPETIDDIYIKNPVRGQPMEPGVPVVVPSLLESRPVPTRAAPPPPKHESGRSHPPTSLSVTAMSDPLHPDWGDFERAQTPSFSPSAIEIPRSTAAPAAPPPSWTKRIEPSSSSSSNHHTARDVWSSNSVAGTNHNRWNTDSSHSHSSNIIIPTALGTASVNVPSASSRSDALSSSSFSNRPAPAPPSHIHNQQQPAVPNVLGNGASRAPVSVQSVPRPALPSEVRRTENRTPPTLNPSNFIQPIVPLPSSASSMRDSHKLAYNGSSLQTSSSSRLTNASSVGVDPQLMAELSKRLNTTAPAAMGGGGSSVRLRSSSSAALTQPVVTVNATGLTLAPAPDPFVVDSRVRDVVQKERYNQIMERKGGVVTASSGAAIGSQRGTGMNQLTPTNASSVARPHSTMGIPLSSMPQQPVPCLIPTQLPIPSKPVSNTDTYRQAVSMNPLPQLAAQSKPAVLPSPAAPAPPSHHHQPAPPPQSVNPSVPLTVRIPPAQSTPAAPSSAQHQSRVQPTTVNIPRSGAGAENAANSARSAAPAVNLRRAASSVTGSASARGGNASSTSAASVAPTPAGTIPRASNNTADSDRRSRIDNEVNSMLPPPSPLFYGTSNTAERVMHKAASTSTLPRPASVASVPTSSLMTSQVPSTTTSTTQIPTTSASISSLTNPTVNTSAVPSRQPPARSDPLPISLGSVLQPTKLYSDPAPAPVTAPSSAPTTRSVDIGSIMNAYNTASAFNQSVVPYGNPLNPNFSMHSAPPMFQQAPHQQMPLFALGGSPRVGPPPYPAGGCGNSMMYGGGSGSGAGGPLAIGFGAMPSMSLSSGSGGVQSISSAPVTSRRFSIGADEDIVAALDPMRPSTASAVPSSSTSSGSAGVSRITQMELLYKDASFCDTSRCDEMVNKCDGDIAVALQELKMDYLMNLGLGAGNKGVVWEALNATNWDLNRAAEKLL